MGPGWEQFPRSVGRVRLQSVETEAGEEATEKMSSYCKHSGYKEEEIEEICGKGEEKDELEEGCCFLR